MILAIFAHCGFTSTRDFLDGKFLSGNKSFQIVAPVAMQQGKVYTVTVSAQINGNTTAKYGGTLNWSVAKGAGVVTQVGAAQFSGGTGTVQIKYINPAITLAQPELVNFRVTDASDSSWTGISNAVTMSALIQPNGFLVTAPQFVTAGASFNVTVTAIGTDSLPNTSFNGSVSLTAQGGGGGTLTPTTVTLTNGTVTFSATFSLPAGGFTIVARDTNDSTKAGISNPMTIGLNDLMLVALPLSTTSIRVNFSAPIGSFSFDLYRKTGVAGYSLVTTLTCVATNNCPTTFYTDTLLTPATQYDYRVDVKNNLGQIIRQGAFSATTSGCGFTQGLATINTPTTWAKASNPICVTGLVTFDTGAGSLTIQPGVQILFTTVSAGLKFQNSASLSAVGSSTDMIYFSTSATSPISTGPNWAGITFTATATGSNISTTLSGYDVISETWNSGSKVQYVVLEYAGPAVATNTALWIEKSLMRRNASATNGGAVAASFASALNLIIENDSFELNKTTGGASGAGDVYTTTTGSGTCIVRASNSFASNAQGGGGGSIILDSAPNSTIAASSFSYNTLLGGTAAGAAVTVGGAANGYTIRDNTFAGTGGNSSNDGAIGIILNGGYNGVKITGNTFNATTGGSGTTDSAIGASLGDQITIQNNTFLGTFGPGAGAIATGTNTTVTIINNTFSGTYSTSADAGAIKIPAGVTGVTVTGNIFSQNYTNGSGGAIQIAGTTTNTTISSNLFDSTYTTGASGHGGAIYVTGNNPGLTIAYNTIQNTYTQGATAFGGGIYINSDASANRNIRYNLFDGSWAKGASAQGGAIYVKTSNTNLQIQHNNFNNTRTLAAGTNMNVLATDQAAASFAMDNGAGITNKRNWWGVDLSAYVACSAVVPASYCSKTGAWDPVINPAASAWNLCSVVSTDPDCVGKP